MSKKTKPFRPKRNRRAEREARLRIMLRTEFNGQRFQDFYNGPLTTSLTGDYDFDSPEAFAVSQKVDEYIDQLVRRLHAIASPKR